MVAETETLGGWHRVAEREVQRLAAAAARQCGQDEDEASRSVFTQVSILLIRENSEFSSNRFLFRDVKVDGEI